MADTRERLAAGVKWPVTPAAGDTAARAGAGAPADAAGDAPGLRQVEVVVLPDQTLRRPDAAAFLGVRPQTLSRWAVRGEGPPYFRLGKFVFYRLADLLAFKAKHAVERLPKQPELL